MRAPFQKAPAPRIRSLEPGVKRGRTAPVAAPQPGNVFREFVATLERLERSKRRKPRAPEGKA